MWDNWRQVLITKRLLVTKGFSMETIHATWQDGVFTPTVPLDLAEGAEVEIRIVPAVSTNQTEDSLRPYPLPAPPFESECQPAPFDLPMPPGGEKVAARMKEFLRPDAHDLAD